MQRCSAPSEGRGYVHDAARRPRPLGRGWRGTSHLADFPPHDCHNLCLAICTRFGQEGWLHVVCGKSLGLTGSLGATLYDLQGNRSHRPALWSRIPSQWP